MQSVILSLTLTLLASIFLLIYDTRRSINDLGLQHRALADDVREIQKTQQGMIRSRQEETLYAQRAERHPAKDSDASPKKSEEVAKPVTEGPVSFLQESRDALLKRFKTLSGVAKKQAMVEVAQLAKLGDGEATQLILDSLNDEDESLREKAVAALGEMANPDHLPQLEQATNDPSPVVREEAAKALVNMPPEQAGGILTKLLADKDREVVEESIQSLGALGYRQAIPYLTQFASSEDLAIATSAGATLRKLGDTAEADSILKRVAAGLESKDPLERKATIKRIHEIGGEAALPYLEKGRLDENLLVRTEAEKAIRRMR
jgi:hypothetical protein